MSAPRGRLVLLLGSVLACLLVSPSPGTAQALIDSDGDGLPDVWEVQFGLNPLIATGLDGATGDPDQDGLTNLAEYAAGSHPRGAFSRAFAEGATGPFFDVRFAVFNHDPTWTARCLVRYFRTDGVTIPRFVTLAPLTRTTIDPETEEGLETAEFSTLIECDVPVVADRTMSWGEDHYGSHVEAGVAAASRTWLLAEGATHSGFDLFYLLQNPHGATASVTVEYLLPAGAPVIRHYALPPRSRTNIWVDLEDPRLASTDVSAAITSSLPIVVERAMYLNAGGRLFGAGHASAGVTSAATTWMLAEGATGPFFDLFVLVANAEPAAADLEVRYLLPDGSTIVKAHRVAGRSRLTIWVDHEDPRLADTAVSTIVRSTNGVPVVVERAMWWPGPTAATWHEAHNAPGLTVTAPRWALAEGEDGGPDDAETYILVANASSRAGTAVVTLHYEGGGTEARTFALPPDSRTTVAVRAEFAGARSRRFAAIVESRDPQPLALVVERAMYTRAGTVAWAAGTAAAATPLPAADGPLLGAPTATVNVEAIDAMGAESGGDTAAFRLTRSGSTDPLTVTFALSGTATPGSDFAAVSNAVIFGAGQTAVTVVVTPIDDQLPELPETVVLTLHAGALYAVGSRPSARAVILDDDQDRVSVPPTLDDVARFLTQATFGPTLAEIERVRAMGYEAWLTEQYNAPPSSFLGYLDAVTDEYVDEPHLQEAWVHHAMVGRDQLRQRVAHALLEILVISDHNGLEREPVALAAYMDVLMRHAFGNFRTLLREVTLNPGMGKFLDMLMNERENPETGQRPNENYARELLQLFTIGKVQLNQDGTVRRGPDGRPIPTYGQAEVDGFSRVFTGWTFHQTTQPYRFRSAPPDWRNPMVAVARRHSPGEKRLLDGVVLPAGQTPEKDLEDALDNVFRHPNVGPFIGRQLIQRLVTSNPSPAYVARVAAAFNDNGRGVRGDLWAVVRAILLDPEARDLKRSRQAFYGKLREPMIRFITVARAFNMRAQSGKFLIWDLHRDIGQAAFKAPSVFNFFQPDFSPAGLVSDVGLVAPEFQISTEAGVIAISNSLKCLVDGQYGPYEEDRLLPDYARELALAATPDALVEHLNRLMLAGGMSPELKQIVRDAVAALPRREPLRRVRAAVLLVVRSPEFAIQK